MQRSELIVWILPGILTIALTSILLMTGCSNRENPVGSSPNDLKAGLIYSNEEVGEREDGTGAFRTHCLESHESNDDPLVAPEQPGAAHHHVFFGNPEVDAFTTSSSLMDAPETTCDGNTLNRSGYWVPALYDANLERIEYVDPLFYYKTGYHLPPSSIQPPPEGLQMIAGNGKATEPQGTTAVKYRCSGWESDTEWFDPGDPLDHVDVLPNCPAGEILEIRIVFPQCWDGVNLSSSDHQSHMAYPSEATPPVAGTGSCPESHPIAIPEISYNFSIYVTEDRGSPTNWRFSSDLHDPSDQHTSSDLHNPSGTPQNKNSHENEGGNNDDNRQKNDAPDHTGGLTLHADWMNGWNPDIMDTIIQNCLRPARECMVGLLGDGTQLDPVVVD